MSAVFWIGVVNRNGRVTGAAAIELREDLDGSPLHALPRNAAQGRRQLALAEICDGASRTDAARIGGATLQIVRDWAPKFNARAGRPDRRHASGPEAQADRRAAPAKAVETGPIPAIHRVVRWRRCDLAQWLWDGPAGAAERFS